VGDFFRVIVCFVMTMGVVFSSFEAGYCSQNFQVDKRFEIFEKYYENAYRYAKKYPEIKKMLKFVDEHCWDAIAVPTVDGNILRWEHFLDMRKVSLLLHRLF